MITEFQRGLLQGAEIAELWAAENFTMATDEAPARVIRTSDGAVMCRLSSAGARFYTRGVCALDITAALREAAEKSPAPEPVRKPNYWRSGDAMFFYGAIGASLLIAAMASAVR